MTETVEPTPGQPGPWGRTTAPPGPRWHERSGPDGNLRAPWDALGGALADLDPRELSGARLEAERLLADEGVTYRPADGPTRPWRLDPIPLVLTGEEWAQVEAGVRQRAELLNLVLADVYGPQELIRSGALPPEVVYAHPGYLRHAHGLRLPGRRQLFACATDVVRDADGRWRAIGDRTDAPSGAAYAFANRAVMARVLGSERRDAQVLRLAPYLRVLRAGLRRLAPADVDDPRIVVLTSGPENETAYEHGALAAALGVPLVEGSDLAVRGGRLQLRSLDELEPVDVVLRRVDADWCDPLELRPDSTLGVPGLVEAARRGRLALANPLGAAVLENAGLLAYLPALSRQLLGQPLHLEPARTWWCGDPEQRAHVLANLDELVVKPLTHGGEHHAGWELTGDQRAELAARVEADPFGWVGQEALPASLVPSLSPPGAGDGPALVDRAAVLRTFVVADDDGYVAMPGGLTRIADPDLLVITNAAGAWSKDTWILSGAEEGEQGYWLQEGPLVAPSARTTAVSVRTADNLVWLGRYAERAEALVRLLRAVDERRADFGGRTGPVGATAVDVLLQAVTEVSMTWPGFAGPDGEARRRQPDEELRDVVVDRTRPGTVAHAIDGVLATAAAVRDRLSSDTWPVANALKRELLADRPGVLDGHDRPTRGALGRVLTGLLALQGLGAESLERDPTWTFIEVGRRTERSLQVLTLLVSPVPVRRPAAVDSLVFESVLGTAESLITYRRRYRSRAQLPTLLDLLLLDTDNPRSVAWQLDRLVDALRLLPDHPGEGEVSEVEQVVLDAATALRVADTQRLATADDEGLRPELWSFLHHLRGRLQEVADLLFTTSLAPSSPLRATLAPSAPAATGRTDAGGA